MGIAEMIADLPLIEQEKLFENVAQYKGALVREKAQQDFLSFVREMWPGFIHGRHHALMAKKFQEIVDGKLKRLIINMPPRHTKSEFASNMLPAWFLGKFPEKKVIQCSNTAELAVGFGRKVRNLVGSEQYSKIFPDVTLKSDSKAAGRWATNHGGDYFALGVGGTVTGKGADLLIIDDPHSEQEAKLAQGDPTVFDSVYEWYTSGPRQRLQPGGVIIVVMCMTGDTDVLMEDGSSAKLKDIRPGDIVATYENGQITTAKINNWQSSGIDSIYTVRTQSGIILRANERHPFLVQIGEERLWIKLKDLKLGMQLVATKDVTGQLDLKQDQENAALANHESLITERTLTPHTDQLDITESGKTLPAANALNLQSVKACANHVIAKSIHLGQELLRKAGIVALSTGTESQVWNMTAWLKCVATNVMCAVSRLLQKILGRTGAGSCVLTTITSPELSEGCSAMTATSPLDMAKPQIICNGPLSTYSIILDQIVEITSSGEEEVFDVEVDRTENFIANGIVSHNTRWSDKDLTGKLLKDDTEWDIVQLPAILPSGNALWPEFWDIKELLALKEELPVYKWNAQYQQTPTGEEGALVKRDWWQRWEDDRPPKCEFIIQSWDTAFTKSQRADYSACTTWGIFHLNENPEDVNIIMLDAWKDKLEFPDLKDTAKRFYDEWQPDACIIEAKAAGAPLIFELRRMGVMVSDYTPVRGNDKFVRINSVTDLFRSGRVWAPETKWAEEVIEEMARFPNAEHDDLVDSTVQALIRFRQGGFLRLDSDEEDDNIGFRRKKTYY